MSDKILYIIDNIPMICRAALFSCIAYKYFIIDVNKDREADVKVSYILYIMSIFLFSAVNIYL